MSWDFQRLRRMTRIYFWSLLVLTNLLFGAASCILWLAPGSPIAKQLESSFGRHAKPVTFR